MAIISSAIFLVIVVIIVLPLSMPIQLISHCVWRWFGFSKNKYVCLSTLIWISINASILYSEHLNHQKAIVERASRSIPPHTALSPTWEGPLFTLEPFFILMLIIGTPIHIAISLLILHYSKRR